MYPIYSCLPLESIGQPFRKLFLHIFKPLCLCVLIMYQELAKLHRSPLCTSVLYCSWLFLYQWNWVIRLQQGSGEVHGKCAHSDLHHCMLVCIPSCLLSRRWKIVRCWTARKSLFLSLGSRLVVASAGDEYLYVGTEYWILIWKKSSSRVECEQGS